MVHSAVSVIMKDFFAIKNPSQYITHCKGRVHSFSRFHPACSATLCHARISKPLNYDDNGITGPDWGHSEVVFGCFPIRCFQHFTSLSVTFHSLLVSSTCFLFLFLWFIISAVFLFVNACLKKIFTDFPSFYP